MLVGGLEIGPRKLGIPKSSSELVPTCYVDFAYDLKRLAREVSAHNEQSEDEEHGASHAAHGEEFARGRTATDLGQEVERHLKDISKTMI